MKETDRGLICAATFLVKMRYARHAQLKKEQEPPRQLDRLRRIPHRDQYTFKISIEKKNYMNILRKKLNKKKDNLY